VQFLACGPNCLTPEVGLATAHLLKVNGVKAGSAGNVCCGLPGQSFGDLEAARRMARANIEILEGFPRAVVLVDDSSCAATIKDWPRLFEDDPAWRARAEAVSRRTRDLLQWLDEQSSLPPPVRGSPREGLPLKAEAESLLTVTYHDACKARFGQGLVEEPRRVLSRSGVDYRELPEADQCCGGGGAYQFMQPGISRAVGERKAQNILSTGAEIVLTSSVSCLLQLQAGLRRARSQVRALHIAEFLAAKPAKTSGRE
jgi:glycolate oxidase iron-sulfur subunit